MIIQRLPWPTKQKLLPGTHYLIVAEVGFSMLNIYGEQHPGLTRERIKKFADELNRRNEAGSLHPAAPISAIPRHYLRDCDAAPEPETLADFKREIQGFLAANEQSIHASKLVVDLHVSPQPVPLAYLDIVATTCRETPCTVLQEVTLYF